MNLKNKHQKHLRVSGNPGHFVISLYGYRHSFGPSKSHHCERTRRRTAFREATCYCAIFNVYEMTDIVIINDIKINCSKLINRGLVSRAVVRAPPIGTRGSRFRLQFSMDEKGIYVRTECLYVPYLFLISIIQGKVLSLTKG